MGGNDVRGNVGVLALSYDENGVLVGGKLVGRIATGGAAVSGLALPLDSRRLYVTSEVAQPGARAANGRMTALAHSGCRQCDGPAQPFGLLSVVDVAKAEQGGIDVVISASAADCSPARTVVSPDGRTVWVAARGDDKCSPSHLLFWNPTLRTRLLVQGTVAERRRSDWRCSQTANAWRWRTLTGSQGRRRPATSLCSIRRRAGRLQRQSWRQPYVPRSISVADGDKMLFLTDYNGGQVQLIVPQ